MIIRNEQMNAMETYMQKLYVSRLIAYYRQLAPEFVNRFSEAQLNIQIASAIPIARGLGINSAEGIMHYAGLVLVAGPQFHRDPKVRSFLTMPGLPPELKLRRLFQLVCRKLTTAAER